MLTHFTFAQETSGKEMLFYHTATKANGGFRWKHLCLVVVRKAKKGKTIANLLMRTLN